MGAEALISPAFVYDVEPRFSVDLDVTILARGLSRAMPGGGEALEARMINFSRRGFCVATSRDLAPGTALALEMRGWPAIDAHVAWSRDGRAGCQLIESLDDRRFEAMLLSVEAIDRAGEWNL